MKNTTVAVNKRPILKQNPVAEALTLVGNNDGIYTDKAPWLIPKKNVSTLISMNVAEVTESFNLNTTPVIMKLTMKHNVIVLRMPIWFTIQPETMLPIKPENDNTIIVVPRNSLALFISGVMLCTHVGAHENTAHKPISIAPKTIEP